MRLLLVSRYTDTLIEIMHDVSEEDYRQVLCAPIQQCHIRESISLKRLSIFRNQVSWKPRCQPGKIILSKQQKCFFSYILDCD